MCDFPMEGTYVFRGRELMQSRSGEFVFAAEVPKLPFWGFVTGGLASMVLWGLLASAVWLLTP
jgi:hypothetical protein